MKPYVISVNGSSVYKNESFVYINEAFVYKNETFVYKKKLVSIPIFIALT